MRKPNFVYEYDPEADGALIFFDDYQNGEGLDGYDFEINEFNNDIIILFNSNMKILGFEIINASLYLNKMFLIDTYKKNTDIKSVRKPNLLYEYNPKTDVALIWVDKFCNIKNSIKKFLIKELDNNISIFFDAYKKIIGFEILNASKYLLSEFLLDTYKGSVSF